MEGKRKHNGGSKECICTKCLTKIIHKKGVPCKTLICPKCGAQMKGESC